MICQARYSLCVGLPVKALPNRRTGEDREVDQIPVEPTGPLERFLLQNTDGNLFKKLSGSTRVEFKCSPRPNGFYRTGSPCY